MTTATKSKKTAKAEAEVITKDGVLARNQFVIAVSIANGVQTAENLSLVLFRMGVSVTSAYTTASGVINLLSRAGLISVANTKPAIRAQLSLTDAGWDALAKTRAFYATERF